MEYTYQHVNATRLCFVTPVPLKSCLPEVEIQKHRLSSSTFSITHGLESVLEDIYGMLAEPRDCERERGRKQEQIPF